MVLGMAFVEVDRETPMLLPVDLREWVPADDPVHFIIEAAQRVELSAFRVKEVDSGKAQYPPQMMLALLIYCYSHGIFSSRKIEAASYRDVCVRYLTGDTHPDHDTICSFRRINAEAFGVCFLEVLRLARELKLLRVGTVAIDGTHIGANASKDKNVSYRRLRELDAKLSEDIADLLERAERADAKEAGGDRLPQEIAQRQALKEKLEQARRKLENRAKAEGRAQMAAYEAKVKAHEDRNRGGGRPKGAPAKKPSEEPRDKQQIGFPPKKWRRSAQ